MKGLLWFILGFGCGVGGTILWLRKDVKKELEKVEAREKASKTPVEAVEANGSNDTSNGVKAREEAENASESVSEVPNAVFSKVKVQYHKIVAQTANEAPDLFQAAPITVPVQPREEEPEGKNLSDIPEGTFEIDKNTYEYDNDNEKERLVYFQGDRVLCTENGTIIRNPAMLLGTEWENWVGHYTENEAYIRNPRLATDYDVYVEGGLYADEYGPFDISGLI